VDTHLLGAAKAALTSNFRGHSYSGPGKEAAISKLKGLYKSHGLDWNAKSETEEIMEAIMEIKSLVTPKQEEPKEIVVHPLDDIVSKLKASYDAAIAMEANVDDKLRSLQPAYEQLGMFIQDSIKNIRHEPTVEEIELQKFQQILAPITQQMSLIAAQVQQLSQQKPIQEVARPVTRTPVRSIQPETSIIPQLSQAQSSNRSMDGKTPKLRQLIERTTF
jgi:hypothetical protein